jgi:hypothetical protein
MSGIFVFICGQNLGNRKKPLPGFWCYSLANMLAEYVLADSSAVKSFTAQASQQFQYYLSK